MSETEIYDWKKHAGQVAGGSNPDDEAIERAVMDQAYGFVAQKAGPLMDTQHRIGFEIVYKNDSNTRIVGIFAFKIDKEILYAPIFFLNGEIKGTELLYRVDSKNFVPLTPEWVEFLIGRGTTEAGRGVDRSHRKNMQADVEFDRISNPPAGGRQKIANHKDVDAEAFHKFAAVCCEIFAEQREAPKVLEKFAREDGQKNLIEALEKWTREDIDFAENLANHTDLDAVLSAAIEGTQERIEKNASHETPVLELFLSLHESMTPAEVTEFAKAGAFIRDTRNDAEGLMGVVYEEGTTSLEGISGAGLYDVVMVDGSLRKAFCSPASDVEFLSQSCDNDARPYGVEVGYDDPWRTPNLEHKLESVVCLRDKSKDSAKRKNVFGKFEKDAAQCIADGDLTQECSSGKAYRLYDNAKGTISEPFYVVSKASAEDGITILKVVPEYGATPKRLKINPDYRSCDFGLGIVGTCGYFIEVGIKEAKQSPYDHSDPDEYSVRFNEDVSVADRTTIDKVLFDGGLDKLAIHKKSGFEYQITSTKKAFKTSPALSEWGMKVALAKELRLPAAEATRLVDEAKQAGAVTFWYQKPKSAKVTAEELELAKILKEKADKEKKFVKATDEDKTEAAKRVAEKSARNGIFVQDEADFDTYNDDFFGVEVDPNRYYALDTETDFDYAPDQRVGDAYNPGEPGGISRGHILNSTPEDLEVLTRTNNLSSLFEHGIVGSLVHTYDSAALIDKYIPDFEQALDSLGRVLFLFYWKPGDFSDAYGTDDMTDLENKISSIFRSFGDLVLDLLKKSKKRQAGNVTTSN
jgi:hypothetical protein